MASSNVDVAIVGAGPGGLALAAGILKAAPHCSVAVFERCPALEPKGAGLNLAVNGQKALRTLSEEAYQACKLHGSTSSTLRFLDAQGHEVGKSSVAEQRDQEQQKYGVQSGNIGWFELQQALLKAVSSSEAVHLGCAFSSYELDGSDVLVRFKDSASGVVRAKLLIGCDGYFSRVRAQWLDDGPPVFGQAVVFRGRVPAAAISSADEPHFLLSTPGRLFLAYPGSKGQLCWTASREQASPDALRRADEGRTVKQQCAELLSDLPATLSDILTATPDDAIVCHEVRYRDPASYPAAKLGDGPVSLVGDAAHAYRPTGQGTNITLEDAVVLARCIAKLGPTPAALRAYEAERLPRWKRVAEQTTAQGSGSYRGKVTSMTGQSAETIQEWREWLYSVDLSL